MKYRRFIAACAVALVAITGSALVVTHDSAQSQTEPTLEGDVAILIADLCERKPEHPRCQVQPSPTPEPSPSPSPSESPTDCQGVSVTAPASIQTAVNNNPTGTTFCLSGTFTLSAPVVPKDGQSFVGPAKLVGNGSDHGFQLRTGHDAGAENVTLTNLDVGGFDVSGVECWLGMTISGGRYHNNLHNGIGCGLINTPNANVLIDGAQVDRNGSLAELGRGGGGMKFARADGLVVRNTETFLNIGDGIWCDVQCYDVRYINNHVYGNTRKGLFMEKGAGPWVASGNTSQGNSCSPEYWDPKPWCPNVNPVHKTATSWGPRDNDSGIGLVSSKNAVIENNVLGGDGARNGIKIRQDDRVGTCSTCGWIISNVVVRNNTMNGDRVVGCNLAGVSGNNC